MQQREEIRQLFERYRQGQCSPEEEAHLHAWFNSFAEKEASGLDELEEAFETEKAPKQRSMYSWLSWAAAAMLVLALGAAFWMYRHAGDQTASQVAGIMPGGNRATLTLEDGRQIDLSEEQSGIVIAEDGIAYTSGKDVLEYDGAAQSNAQLLLSTPAGGTYQVVLSDGTKVWLNAGSKLRYPLRFSDEERLVELEGEAYFDVKSRKRKDRNEKLRFMVKTRNQMIEVLGTGFNVSAYADDRSIKTTLVEGRVRLTGKGSNAPVFLSPGEQADNIDGALKKRTVNTIQYTAWKDGDFHFDNTPLSEMMKQVERWYDIEVVYEQEPPQEVFSGVMSRNVSLETVLELLNISEVEYRIENKRIIIK